MDFSRSFLNKKGGDEKKNDDWFDVIAKTMISNFELLHTNIYQP